jgi:hypothetical protein
MSAQMFFSIRLYRKLLRLYPAGFRMQYAVNMLEDFEAEHREAQTTWELSQFWCDILRDLIISASTQQLFAVAERIRQSRRRTDWAFRRMFRCWRSPRYRIPQCPAFWGRPMPRLIWMDILGNALGLLAAEILVLLAWWLSLDGPTTASWLTAATAAGANTLILGLLVAQLVTRRVWRRG